MKKICVPLIVFQLVLLMVTPVFADGANGTNITTITATPATIVTTIPAYPVNTTATPVFANATAVPVATNTTVPTETAAVPTGNTGAPSTGNLSVASSPLGADILIDGVIYGSTPRNVTGISSGNHIIRLTLSGYYDYEGTVYVIPDQVTDVFGTLPPLSASVSSPSASLSPAVTSVPATTVPVQTTTTSSGDLLSNPTILAALIGIVTAGIGAFAAIFPHLAKSKK